MNTMKRKKMNKAKLDYKFYQIKNLTIRFLSVMIMLTSLYFFSCNAHNENQYGTYADEKRDLYVELSPSYMRFLGSPFPDGPRWPKKIVYSVCNVTNEGNIYEFSSREKPFEKIFAQTEIKKIYNENKIEKDDITIQFIIDFDLITPSVMLSIYTENDSSISYSDNWLKNNIEFKLDRRTPSFTFSIRPCNYKNLVLGFTGQYPSVLEVFYPNVISCGNVDTVKIKMPLFSELDFPTYYFVGERCYINENFLYWNNKKFKKISNKVNTVPLMENN